MVKIVCLVLVIWCQTFLSNSNRGKAQDSGIAVSEFEFQLHYYVHFRMLTLGKGMNPFILLTMG